MFVLFAVIMRSFIRIIPLMNMRLPFGFVLNASVIVWRNKMLTVSFQGAQLSPGQRQRLEQQERVRAFMSSPLQQQVNQTLQVLEQRKEQGTKPEPHWTLDYQTSGTPSIAEYMGY